MSTVLESVDKLSAQPGHSDAELGSIRRAQRDALIARELEQIKNIPNIDKQAYINHVLKNAQEIISKNAENLGKLKTLRENPEANKEELKKLFNENPDLIKARAYLILAIGLTKNDPNSDIYKQSVQYLDADVSTTTLIDKLSEKVVASNNETDPAKSLTILHDGCVEAATIECGRIISYLNDLQQKPATPPAPATPTTPPAAATPQAPSTPPAPAKNNASVPKAAKFGINYEAYQSSSNSYSSPDDGPSSPSVSVVGVRLTVVGKGSAAEKAGLVVGDVITSWNRQPVRSKADLDRLLEDTKVKETYSIELTRASGKTVIVPIVSEVTRPKTQGLGIVFERHRIGWFGNEEVNAVHFSQVPPDSLGHKLGLRPGMLISGINGQQIAHSTDFTRLLQEAIDKGGDITLNFMSPYNGKNSIVIPAGTNFYGFIDENKELAKQKK
jgi:hypothetical protein